jgi:hypothetical protein
MFSPGAIAVVAGLIGALGGAAGQSALRHPGRVVEFESQKPLSVSVKAWPNSKESGKDGNCPLYGESPFDSAISSPDGSFGLTINRDKGTYTTVYCHSAYIPRVDRDIPNGNKDGEPIIPLPTFLYPVDEKSAGIDPAALDDVVKRRIIGALNDLAYIRKVRPDRFERAIAELAGAASSSQRSSAITRLAESVQTWSE